MILALVFTFFFSSSSPYAIKQDKLDSASDSLRVHLLSDLCYEYRFISQDSAIHFGRQAIELAHKIDYPKGLAQGYNDLGIIYSDRSNLDSARLLYNQSLDIRKSLGDSLGTASLYNKLGILFQRAGVLDSALHYQFRALYIYEAKKINQATSYCLNNIAIIFSNQGNNESSLEYHAKALDIRKQIGDTSAIAASFVNIGNVLKNLSLKDSALSMYYLALPLLSNKNALDYLGGTFNNIATIYLEQQSLDSAKKYLNRALEIRLEINDVRGLVSCYHNLVHISLEEKNYSLAKVQLEEAIEIAKQNDIYASLAELNLLYVDWALATKNYEIGLNRALEHKRFQDTITSFNSRQMMAELQTQYETEKKEQQIALQRAKIVNQQAALRFNYLLIAALVIVIILGGVIMSLIRSQERRKQNELLQEAKLQLKEAQIESALTSQEQERKRFARDLHDGFGQFISVLNLNLKLLEKGTSNREEVFENSAQVLDQMYQELKTICFNLMPETLIKQGVVNGIKEFADRINTTGKVKIEVDAFGLEERLKDIQEISIYRITQEWVNNILKYSDASKINIQLTKDESEITLMIEDDGVGFDKTLLTSGKGNGWKNLNSRTNLIKGELELDTQAGVKGSALILNVPVLKETEEVVI